MSNENPGLPSWDVAMQRVAGHLLSVEAQLTKYPKTVTREEEMSIAQAWIAYARELTNHHTTQVTPEDSLPR
jgi:hypothetical protein